MGSLRLPGSKPLIYGENGWYFIEDVYWNSFYEEFARRCTTDHKSVFVEAKACRQVSDNLLAEPTMPKLTDANMQHLASMSWVHHHRRL